MKVDRQYQSIIPTKEAKLPCLLRHSMPAFSHMPLLMVSRSSMIKLLSNKIHSEFGTNMLSADAEKTSLTVLPVLYSSSPDIYGIESNRRLYVKKAADIVQKWPDGHSIISASCQVSYTDFKSHTSIHQLSFMHL